MARPCWPIPRIEAVVLALPACFRIELGLEALRARQTSVDREAGGAQRGRGEAADRGAGGAGCGLLFLAVPVYGIGAGGRGLDRSRASWAHCVCCVAGRSRRRVPRRRSPAPAWRLSRALNGGGILANWGCYDLDYLLGVCGWRLQPETALAQSWQVPAIFADTVAPEAGCGDAHHRDWCAARTGLRSPMSGVNARRRRQRIRGR